MRTTALRAKASAAWIRTNRQRRNAGEGVVEVVGRQVVSSGTGRNHVVEGDDASLTGR
jgi:hypothetical protein